MGTQSLNLGAGNRIIGGAVNHDLLKHRPEIDVAWDLNDLPWPWEDEAFQYICARSILEHLKLTLLESMNECWRILRVDGIIEVKLPHWASEASHNDPSHRWYFGLGVFDQLDPSTLRGKKYPFYTPYKWSIQQCAFSSEGCTSFVAVLRKLEAVI